MREEIKGLQIALTGKMRSGKDLVGLYLIAEHGFKRFAFGDGIVKTAMKLFPDEFMGEKPRKLLQEFGQDCVGIDKNVWVNFLFREMLYQGIDPLVDNVVITDLRQPHEHEKLVESGFVIVRVNTEDELRKERIMNSGETFSEENFNHITEQFVDGFEVDFDLENNRTPEELIEQVACMLMNITGGGQ